MKYYFKFSVTHAIAKIVCRNLPEMPSFLSVLANVSIKTSYYWNYFIFNYKRQQ